MAFWNKQRADSAAPADSGARRRRLRAGSFSAGLTALAVAAVVVFNLLLAQLPDTATQFDMTNSGIYKITETTQTYLSGMKEDVEIHVLAAKSGVDSRIVRFLSKYEDLSEHLKVEYTDPVAHPSVLSKYNCEANTIVITCAATGRQETVAIDDIIGYDQMSYYYYGTKKETDFDAEGLLTSAVDGVLTDASRTVYATSGHDEAALPAAVTDQLKKAHMSVKSVNLLTDGGIPDPCDLLILCAPDRDLADSELTALEDYLAKGGQVIYCMAGKNLSLPNLEKLCRDYGLTVAPGIVADPQRCYQNNAYLFFPTVDTSVDAAGGVSADSTLLFYGSRGMSVGTPARTTITVKPFLTTSDESYAVVDEQNMTQGSYCVGAVATEKIDDSITARLTVYGSGSLVDENLLGSFTNVDDAALFVGSATCGFGDISQLNIQPVSLTDPTNTVPTGGLWAALFIFVLPAAALVIGFVRWAHRRRL